MLSTTQEKEKKRRVVFPICMGKKESLFYSVFFFSRVFVGMWNVGLRGTICFQAHVILSSFFSNPFLVIKYSKYISLCFYVRCNFSESRNTYRNNSKRLVKRPHTHSYIIYCRFEARELMFFALCCSYLIIEIPFPITSTRPYVYSQKQNQYASILY